MTRQDECRAINDLTALLIEHAPAAMASALAYRRTALQDPAAGDDGRPSVSPLILLR